MFDKQRNLPTKITFSKKEEIEEIENTVHIIDPCGYGIA